MSYWSLEKLEGKSFTHIESFSSFVWAHHYLLAQRLGDGMEGKRFVYRICLQETEYEIQKKKSELLRAMMGGFPYLAPSEYRIEYID